MTSKTTDLEDASLEAIGAEAVWQRSIPDVCRVIEEIETEKRKDGSIKIKLEVEIEVRESGLLISVDSKEKYPKRKGQAIIGVRRGSTLKAIVTPPQRPLYAEPTPLEEGAE